MRGVALITAAGTLAFSSTGLAQNENQFTPENGAVSIEWEGDEQARSGQTYEYTLRARNVSDGPVRGVVVHQTVPSSIEIQSSTPEARKGTSDGWMGAAESTRLMEAERRRRGAADAAERGLRSNQQSEGDQAEKQNGQAGQGDRDGRNEAGNRRQAREDGAQDRQENASQQYSWRLGALDAGESREIQVTGLPSGQGSAETCVWVSYQPTFCRTIEVVKPDLELSQEILDKQGSPRDLIYQCEPILVRYALTNTGSGETKAATLKVNLPEGLAMEENDDTSIEVKALRGGESVERLVRLQATQMGTFSISATATSGDITAESGTGSVEIVRPELELNVQGPDRAYLGRSITYHVEVRNRSDVAALDTKVEFPVAANALRFSSTGQQIDDDVDTFVLGRIEGGEEKSFGITFDPRESGSIETKAVVRAYCAQDQSQTVRTAVEGIPAVQIVVVDRDDPVKVDQETVYEVQVKNEGTAKDLNLQLTGHLPPTLEFVSADGETEVRGDGAHKLEFGKVENLDPGDVASWLVTVKGVEAGRGAFRVELQSDASQQLQSSEPTTVY